MNGITSMDDGIVLAKSHQNSIAEDGVKGRCDAEQDGSIWISFAPRLVQRSYVFGVTSSTYNYDLDVPENGVDGEIKIFAMSDEDDLVDFPAIGRRRSSLPKMMSTLTKGDEDVDSFCIGKKCSGTRRASTGKVPIGMEVEMRTFPPNANVHKSDEKRAPDDYFTNEFHGNFGIFDEEQDEECISWIPSEDDVINDCDYLVDYARDYEHIDHAGTNKRVRSARG